MKKFYTMLLAAFVGMVCSLGAHAQDEGLKKIKVTLNVDRDNAVEYKIGYNGDFHTLVKGDNVVELTGYKQYGDSWSFDSIIWGAIGGFKIESIACPDDANCSVNDPYSTSNYIYMYEKSDGYVYTITTSDLSEMRTSKLNINVTDDATGLKIARKNLTSEAMTSGESTFMFDPNSELPLTITAENVPCYSVTLDDVELEANSAREYIIEPTDGQTLEITNKWPAGLKSNVTINIADEMKGAVKLQVYPDGGWTPSDVEGFVHNQANSVEAGHYYFLKFDTEGYEITSVKRNGVADDTSSHRVFVGKNDEVIDVEAKVKERFHFIINVKPGSKAKYDVQGYSDYRDLVEGENFIYPEKNYWGGYSSVYIKAADNYKITKFECVAAGDQPALPSSPTEAMMVYPNENTWSPVRTYDLETVNLDELRANTLNVTVVGSAGNILFRRKDNSPIGLATGENVIKFAEDELPLRVSPSYGAVPMYRVVLNGEAIQYDANSYVHELNVADGDKLELEAAWPADKTTAIFIDVPEEAKAVLTKIQYGTYPYTEITEWVIGEPIEIPCGNMVTLNLNTADYNVTSLSIDGQEKTGISGNVSFFLGEDPVDIKIEANKYGTYKFHITVNDPEHVGFYPGSIYGTDPYVLVAGERKEFEIDERYPTLCVKPVREWCVKSIVDANTQEVITLDYSSSFKVKDGMDLVVTVSEIEYDGKWVFWIEDINDIGTSWSSDDKNCYYYDGSENVYMTESGHNINKFATAVKQALRVSAYLSDYDQTMYAYLNNDLLKEPWSGWGYYYTYSDYKPTDGDVLRFYTKSVQPTLHAISFEVAGAQPALADGITVVTDKVKTRDDWKSGFEILTGAHIALTLPEGAEGVKISLDDADMEPDADGTYSFIASADHKVTINTPSGIANVNAADANELGAVYNMQGIKVLDAATKADLKKLPAGIYIVNGEKKVIR